MEECHISVLHTGLVSEFTEMERKGGREGGREGGSEGGMDGGREDAEEECE